MTVIQGTFLFLWAVSLCAFWATVHDWRRGRAGSATGELGRGSLKLGLLLAGPVLVALAYAVAQHGVSPIADRFVWPIVRGGIGWPEELRFESPYPFLQWVLAVGAASSLAVLLAAVMVGSRETVRPLDGYWLTNPVSLAAGYVLYHAVLGHRLPYAEYKYWGAAMWVVQVLLACPVYAWLFYKAATWRAGRMSGRPNEGMHQTGH
jgi:hypothetical protein